MSNPLSQGSSGGRPPFNPTSISVPRRISYASVVSGTTPANQHSGPTGVLSHSSTQLIPPYPYLHSRIQDNSLQQMAAQYPSRGSQQVSSQWRRTQTEQYSGPYGQATDHASVFGDRRSLDFFVPSYLKGSKHVERLEKGYQARIMAQREGRSSRSLTVGSLPTSASNSNLHKMVPSHRGMTHEIVERSYVPLDDQLSPLPTRWSQADKCAGLEIQGSDGLEIKFAGVAKPQDDAAAVRADHPIPRECGIYYFEVTVLGKSKEGLIGVGFSGSKVSLSKLPGWEPESWAYHGDDGYSFCQTASGKSYGQKFGSADIIGCGVNFRTGSAFFTKNGVNLGTAFREIKAQTLYPSVGMKKPGEHLRVNFGQSPFIYDIDRMIANDKEALEEEISMEDPKALYGQHNETSLLQNLVMQYMAHEGYIETAKSFTKEVQTSSQLLHGMHGAPVISEYKEDLDAVNRQKIRAAILNGDIDQALKHTNVYYPSVLEENESIYFKLRCRKFVEMIAKTSELQAPSNPKQKSYNPFIGHAPSTDFEAYMDVDDPGKVIQSNIEESSFLAKQAELVNDALQYGQELQSEFKDDSRREVKQALKDTFALIAYPDARESSLASLLEAEGRVTVAEELNSAILVSLGKSSSAALERLYQQTEVLVDDISEGGGIGALINVRQDYLL